MVSSPWQEWRGARALELRAQARRQCLPLIAALALLAAGSSCGKNDMFKQASIRPGENPAQPAPGSVPMSGREPEAVDEEVFDRLVNPIATDSDSTDRGRRLFADHCSPCHGTTGNGDGVLVDELGELDPLSGLVGDAVSDGYLYSVIRHGGASMPAYGPDLAIPERWDLVNYLRTLAQDE